MAAVLAARNVFRYTAGIASKLPTRPGVAIWPQEEDKVNEVTESFELKQPMSGALSGRESATDFLDLHGLRLPTRGRTARAPWKTTLADADLQCLLRVIEGELIPRLISEYSPARCSPQDSVFSSD